MASSAHRQLDLVENRATWGVRYHCSGWERVSVSVLFVRDKPLEGFAVRTWRPRLPIWRGTRIVTGNATGKPLQAKRNALMNEMSSNTFEPPLAG